MQGKTDSELLSWLAGFIDGEGSFCFVLMSGERWQPRIQIANTHYPTLEPITRILDRLGLPYYVGHKRSDLYPSPDKYRRKAQWVIMAVGIKRTERWCRVLLDYLITKRMQAELMLEFDITRQSQQHSGSSARIKKPLTERQVNIIKEVTDLNGNKRKALARFRAINPHGTTRCASATD